MRSALLVVLGLTAVAHAEPRVAALEPPGMTPVAESAQADVPQARNTIDRRADRDAAYDRGFFSSTALVLGQGSFDISARSALNTGGIASIAAGLGGHAEISVDAAKVGRVGEQLGVGFKLGVARRDRYALAVTASAHDLYPDNHGDTITDASQLYAVSMRFTTCVGGACGAQFTLGAGLAAASNPYKSIFDDIMPTLDASLILGTGYVRPLIEVTILDGELGYLGLRFGGRHVAVDAGIGALVGDSWVQNTRALAMVGLSVRP